MRDSGTIRVGLVLPRRLQQPTGIVNYSRRLAEEFAQSQPGLDVVLLTRCPDPDVPAWCRQFEYHRLPARSVRYPFRGGWTSTARRLDLDLLHVTGNIAPFVGPRRGVKRVVSVHDAGPLVSPGDRSVRERLIHAAAIPALRLTADAIVTDSQASARDLRALAGIPTRMMSVTPLAAALDGVVDSTDRDRSLAEERFFLAVGDVAAHKNLLGVLKAFAMVRRASPEARLVISGRESHGSGEIKAAATDLGDSVSFTGFVDDGMLDKLFREAEALVFPSFHEGFGLPILEAMTRGTPVITSNCSSLVEVAGDAALLVDPSDIGAIADAMLGVLRSEELAADLGARGLRRVQDFSWRQTADLTAGVYRDLMRRDAEKVTEGGRRLFDVGGSSLRVFRGLAAALLGQQHGTIRTSAGKA